MSVMLYCLCSAYMCVFMYVCLRVCVYVCTTTQSLGYELQRFLHFEFLKPAFAYYSVHL